jgi:hypothetical protein
MCKAMGWSGFRFCGRNQRREVHLMRHRITAALIWLAAVASAAMLGGFPWDY